jgi:hypothetical protein
VIWTVIYRGFHSDELLTKVVYGAGHGKVDTLAHLAEEFDGEVLAIVAGDQVVYFSSPAKSSLCDEVA